MQKENGKTNEVKRIVIVGGGFGGITFIKTISRDKGFHVTLVDTNNYHFFTPLLYQVATAFIEPSNISYPFRRMFQERENLRFHLGTLLRVNSEQNTIDTDNGILEYDYLVLAIGTESNFFNLENVKRYALPMKTIGNALNMRNHILLSMEQAVHADDKIEKEKFLTIVIAGGGPSGVEVAGMIAELGRHIAVREYPEITNLKSYIHLISSSPVLLGPMSKIAQDESLRVLLKLGVHVQLNVAVKDYVDGKVLLSSGESILANTLIWAPGVIGREIPGLPPEFISRGRRVMVDEHGKVNGTKNVFAIGDIALQTTDSNYKEGHPQVAQVAIQQGRHLAQNFIKMRKGGMLQAFRYKNKGSMAIISKYQAVADLPGVSFSGIFAWLIWLFIHIIPLAGFRNKLKLAFNWFTAFISNDPALRLIIRPRKNRENKP